MERERRAPLAKHAGCFVTSGLQTLATGHTGTHQRHPGEQGGFAHGVLSSPLCAWCGWVCALVGLCGEQALTVGWRWKGRWQPLASWMSSA